MNGLEHIFFTIKNLAFAPGFWSGLLFLIIAVLGFRKLYQEKLFKLKILILGFFTNILFYWTLPMVLFITFSDHIGAIVGT
ncbi:MAG: hypothetical protein JEY91_16690 [Spirochaetaceae bacterium]|nr:hypothetical protein [Spirochaetaceae bacterium]